VPSDFSSERSLHDASPVVFGVVAALGITLLFQFGAVVAGRMVPPDATGPLLTALPLGIAQLAVMLLPTLYLHRAQSLPPSELLRLRPAPIASYVAAAVGTLAIWQLLQSYQFAQELFMVPESLHGFYTGMEREAELFFTRIFGSGNIVELAAALIVGAAIPAISEELLFRGAAQRSFERSLRRWPAILLSAFLFATLHLSPVTWIALFALGVFFGYVAQRTGSILPSALSHFLFNAISLVALYRFGDGAGAPGGPHTLADLRATLLPSGVALVLLAIVLRWLASGTGVAHVMEEADDGAGR
jgi:membrane protease YdiL (CAAX protease family)